MRLDRLITLSLAWPLRRTCSAVRGFVVRRPAVGRASVPVLMYHSISGELEPEVAPYFRVNTSPAVFRRHLQFLAEQGYQTITLTQLAASLTARSLDDGREDQAGWDCGSAGVVNPARAVALTFDDGFQDFYTEAFPALKEHGFTATVFLPTAFIGTSRRPFCPSNVRSRRTAAKECLTWSEVKELHRAGVEFGSHTVSHPKLVELQWPDVTSEIVNSKAEIEDHLGEPTTSFCYPFAFPQADHAFARCFRDLLAGSGYTCCATTELGRVQQRSDPYRLARLPANTLDDLSLFAAKLEGAYDWLAAPQSAAKTLKGFLRQSSGKRAVRGASTPPKPPQPVRSTPR